VKEKNVGLFNKLAGEFVDVIEWTDDSDDTMVYRFERYNNEIKYGAKLTVRQSQLAVFVNEGLIADIFEPGMYTLDTRNVPILSTLQGWKHGLESPFKAEVYFVNTRQFVDLKWGTKNPVILRDAEFGMVRARAFGTYAIRISDSEAFITEIVGTDNHFTTDEITEQLRNLIVTRFATVIAQSKIPVLDLAVNYEDLGQFLTNKIMPEFNNYGLELTKMLVENISLPEEVEQAMDKRTSMGVVGNLQQYTQFQMAESMRAAAENPGGTAAGGMGLGMGFVMANQMGQAMGQQGQAAPQQAPTAPPPLPASGPVFFAAIGGKQAGPFDMGSLAQQVAAGSMAKNTLVWTEGMSGWQAAGEVEALSSLFPAAPPPLPT
jgi:membrane protease subunit (stomatin/prohibitin family)